MAGIRELVDVRRQTRLTSDAVGSHRLVVFVLHDVAMPDVEPGLVELRFDAGNLPWVRDHGVLEAALPALRRTGAVGADALTVDHLKLHFVYVDGMRIGGEVDELPDLSRIRHRVLGDGIVPAILNGIAIEVDDAESRRFRVPHPRERRSLVR